MSKKQEDDEVVNKQGWLWLAPQYFDQWRVFPRIFIVFYLWLCMQTAIWFMSLADPTTSQAGFAGAIVSAGAAWFGLYVNSGPRPVTLPEMYTTQPLPSGYPPTGQPTTPIPEGTKPRRTKPRREEPPEPMNDDGTPQG